MSIFTNVVAIGLDVLLMLYDWENTDTFRRPVGQGLRPCLYSVALSGLRLIGCAHCAGVTPFRASPPACGLSPLRGLPVVNIPNGACRGGALETVRGKNPLEPAQCGYPLGLALANICRVESAEPRRGGKTTGRRWSGSATPVTQRAIAKWKLRRSDGLQAGGGAIVQPLYMYPAHTTRNGSSVGAMDHRQAVER